LSFFVSVEQRHSGKIVAMPLKDPQARKDYERERKNKKRLEAYNLLPEPERTRKLQANKERRAYKMRWTSDKILTKNY
jgi:hypothetical protein